uniref:Uncharacterized protein n=1 Tax=Scophthalmus maximus TaxID=52904 RepID=A0A8D3EAP7_SCOMX
GFSKLHVRRLYRLLHIYMSYMLPLLWSLIPSHWTQKQCRRRCCVCPDTPEAFVSLVQTRHFPPVSDLFLTSSFLPNVKDSLARRLHLPENQLMEISKDYGTRISSALNRINWDVSYRFEKAHCGDIIPEAKSALELPPSEAESRSKPDFPAVVTEGLDRGVLLPSPPQWARFDQEPPLIRGGRPRSGELQHSQQGMQTPIMRCNVKCHSLCLCLLECVCVWVCVCRVEEAYRRISGPACITVDASPSADKVPQQVLLLIRGKCHL